MTSIFFYNVNEETATRTNLITISELWYATVATELRLDAGLYQKRNDLSFCSGKSHPWEATSLEKHVHVQKDWQEVCWRWSVTLRHDLQCQEEQQIL